MSRIIIFIQHMCTISLCTRIGGIIAATHQILDDDGFAAVFCLFNIDDNITSNASSCIVTTINIPENSAGDSQDYIASNICIIRTAMNIFYFIAWTTCQNHIYVTIHIRLIASTIKTGNN